MMMANMKKKISSIETNKGERERGDKKENDDDDENKKSSGGQASP